jgi:hypothetical protein
MAKKSEETGRIIVGRIMRQDLNDSAVNDSAYGFLLSFAAERRGRLRLRRDGSSALSVAEALFPFF